MAGKDELGQLKGIYSTEALAPKVRAMLGPAP